MRGEEWWRAEGEGLLSTQAQAAELVPLAAAACPDFTGGATVSNFSVARVGQDLKASAVVDMPRRVKTVNKVTAAASRLCPLDNSIGLLYC